MHQMCGTNEFESDSRPASTATSVNTAQTTRKVEDVPRCNSNRFVLTCRSVCAKQLVFGQ